jgi:AraC-like DNA-binding protein
MPRSDFSVDLKYWHHAHVEGSWEKEQDARHRHNHWQIDIAEEGAAVMRMGDEDFPVAPASIVIIPPGTVHYYRYDGRYRNWSFKFEADHDGTTVPDPCVIPATDASRAVGRMLQTVMNQYTPGIGEFSRPEHISDIVLVEHQLAGILSWTLAQRPRETVSDKVRRLVGQNHGKPLLVDDAARTLGYSRVHLNVLVKKASGITVKRLIDEERSRLAKRLLRYSDLNTSEAAEAMGFPDVFGFSKFVKRLTGFSPKHWRGQQDAP